MIDLDYNFNNNNRLGSGHQLIRIKIKPKPCICTVNRVENCCATVFAAFGRGLKNNRLEKYGIEANGWWVKNIEKYHHHHHHPPSTHSGTYCFRSIFWSQK